MDIQPNAQGKKFNLTPLSPKDFELAPVTAEAFMPENLGGITPEQPGIEVPEPEEPQKRQGYFQGLGQSLKVSLNNLAEMPLQLPQATEALGNMVFDRFSEGVINRGVKRGEIDPKTAVILKGNKDLFTPKASLGLPALPGTQSLGENISESKLTKWFEDNQEELKSTITRYDKTATEYLKNKQFGKALGAISYGVAESFAPTIAAAFTPYGAVTLGVGTAALKYDEVKDRDDMAEGMKVADAVTTGIFEWLFEKYGTFEMTKWLRGVYSKAGAEGLQKAINSGPVINLLSQAYKKFGVWFAPVHEGLSEGLTTIGQNLASQFSGEDPDLDWKDNVVDSFLIGTGMGGAFGGTAALAKKRVEVNSERFARKDKLAIDTFGEDKINELADLMRVGDNEGISAFSYSLEIPEGDGRGKMVSSLWSLARRRASQPLTVPEDPDAPIKAEINQYGEKLKFNSNVPLAEDQNPLISIASHKIEDKKFFLTGESGAIGDHVFTAYDLAELEEAGYDLTQVRPQLIKASDIRERMDIPYQEWLQQEVNQFKQAQVQGQQMVVKAQAPVMEGQEVTLKDKVFVVTAVDETGVTLNEMDKDGNVTGATLPVPPEDYEKVFGVPAANQSGQISPDNGQISPENVTEQGQPVLTDQAAGVTAAPVQLPVNKKGEIEYDQITEPAVYAQGLTEEFGTDAPMILDKLIAKQNKALVKAENLDDPIKSAREVKSIKAELTKLTQVKDIINPPTAIAEGTSLEAPSASPVVEQPEPIEQATEQDLARPEEEEKEELTPASLSVIDEAEAPSKGSGDNSQANIAPESKSVSSVQSKAIQQGTTESKDKNKNTNPKDKIQILRNLKYIESGETKNDLDYEPDDTEYNQRKVYIPTYVTNWHYADNTDPDRSVFDSIDKALNDLQTPGDYSETDKYTQPTKELTLELQEAWIDQNDNIVENGDVIRYDDFAYANKSNDFVRLFGNDHVIGNKTFNAREATSDSLLQEVWGKINGDIISEHNGKNIDVIGSGKYRTIVITDTDGNEIKSIKLRIADHSYNPDNNDSDARAGNFISIEIANNNETAQRFHGAFGIRFNGDNAYDDVITAVNARIIEIIGQEESQPAPEPSPEVELTKPAANEQQGTDQETGKKADNTTSPTEEDTTQRSDQASTEGTGGEAEFAGEALENTPRTRSLREFTKGDHVKNIKTGNEYVVISVPKTGDVSLKKLKGKEIQNFNGKSSQWIPIQREIKAKGAKRTVKFGPDSQKGKLLARMPQTFKEYVLQFFVRGGRVSHKDFLRYVGWKAGKKEGFIWAVKGAAVDPEGKTEQGKAFDSFWEDVPEEWGRRGGTEDTNEIADILKTYPSITQMMDELKRLQSTDESVPDRNMPSPEELGAAVSDADIEDDLENHEDETDNAVQDIMDNPEVKSIIEEYLDGNGVLSVDKLLDDLDADPGKFTIFPFALKKSELIEFKSRLQDEQRNRKAADQTGIKRPDSPEVQDTKQDADRSDQGDAIRTGPDQGREGEGKEVGSPGREFKYKMNARPFDIGTYPKDGFVKAEDDPRGGFQILTYNRKLTEKERNHWSFLPLTEIDDLEGKQFEDQDGEYFVDLEWMPNYSGADVSMFDSKNQLVEKPYFMSTNDILKNIESGYWVEKKEAEKSKETPKDDIDKINDILDKPVESTKGPSYSPIQQKQIDKINKEYSELIAKKEAAIVQAEKDMREALLKADNRNGLFGDTNPVEKDEIIKRDEQGFTYDEATRAAVRKPFEEKMAELRKEIEELRLEQKGKIESVTQQQDLFADTPAEPAESKPIDKESLPKHEDFGQKIGGARKDMEITRKVRDTDSLPAWRRKYHYANANGTMTIGEPVDTSKPFIVQWSKDINSWAGKRTIYRPITTIDTRETKIFNSEEEAEAYIPIYEVWNQHFRVRKSGDNYVITKTSSTNKVVEYATFPTEEEANTYMYSTEGATSLLNHKREDFSIPALDKVERTGKDWRKGKDISTEEFMETFGFRGGEFGNWVKPEERRVMLNAAYDSFMDLAELLGVPPRSLSLSGELSIAFGARGVKGAAAHFEPDRAVINLTRMNGAGSLAHEWAHALDNYFGLQAAKKDYSRNDKGEVKAGKVMRTEAGLLAIQGMRKALSEKFDKIIEATQEKSVTRKMGIDEKQLAFDKFQKSVKREADDLIKKFTNGVRRYQYNRKTKQREDVVVKATPEQIKKAKVLVDKITTGQGTKPTWDRIPGSKSRFGDYSYISTETLALDELHKAVFGKTGLKRDGAGFYNLGYHTVRMYGAKETLDKALAGESETLTVPTDFLKESKWFDKSRANPYWGTKVEMFARAFEYFIEPKLLNQNVRADYLQYDKAPVYDAVYGKNPYPQGDERAEINKLFQQFFDELKTKEEDGRTVMFRTSNDTYYSPIEKALKSVKQNKATVKQWKAMLLNNGAKQAELEWMGWDDAIEQGKPDRSLTKDELQKWIDQSKIDIHEVEMSDEKVMEKLDELNKQLNEAQEEYDRISESELGGRPYYSGSPLRWLYKTPSGNIMDVPEEHLSALEYYAEKKQAYDEYVESLGDPMSVGDGTKYGQYTLPGGKDYKELLLTMPSNARFQIKPYNNGYSIWDNTTNDWYRKDLAYNDPMWFENEAMASYSMKTFYAENNEKGFISSHWDEPNILAHVRFNTRTSEDGKNILFIEEIQSDWAQQGKKKGFRGVFDEQRFEKWYKENKHSTDPTWEEYQELSDSEKKEYRDAFTDEIAQMGFVPNMPFKKTDQWAGLAVRRMIRYAIDEGYDAIAWTPGEVQSDRYDLRKHIDDLRWIHEKNGSYSIMGYQGEGKVFERSVPNEGLEEFVGKEIAGRMRENKSMTGQIKGEQLRIGGSGMTGFYDEILPTIANKIGKKFGAKVEPLIVVGYEESRLALRYQEVKKRLSEIESRKNELIRLIKENKGEEISTKLADEYNSYNNEENDLRQEESDLERRVSPKVLYKQTYTNAVHSLPITNSMFDSFREGVPYFRIVDNPIADILDRVDQSEREFEVKSKIKALSKELNTPVVIVKSRTDLPQTIQADAKRKGLFGNESIYGVWNAPTGTMYIIMDDVMRQGLQRGLVEATKTILHEAVAHKGLPAMLGEEAYNEFLDELYDSIPADDISLIKYEYDTKDKRTIAAEYLAMMAEDNVNPSLFQRVVAMIRRLLRRVFSLDYSENDVYDMLRRSAENLRKQKRANTEFAGEYLEGAGETNILYRTNKPSDRFAGDWLEEQPEVGPNPELLKSAAQIYAERQAKGNISETVQGIREYIQDMNLPVRKFEEDVLKRGGQQDNNSKPYRDMNLSFGRQEKLYTDYFDKKMKPIFKAIAAIKKAGVRGEDILPYVIAKHAVERNPIMRGEALRAWVDGHQDATADEIDAKRAELKDLDYSGVKSFDGKNEYENPDALARDIVKAFEATVDKALIDNFWNSVRTATSATLDTWEAGNQISAEQKKKYLEQYRFFVPLRGWRHGAAKELIYTRGEGFSKSLQKAEGRKSLADNPLAYILSVQFQAIAEQVDNEVNTSMYNLILKNLKNPEINELATIKKLYYVKIKHSDGTEEWEPTEQRPDQELFASGDAKTKIYREHERLRKSRQAKEHEVVVHKPGGDMIIVFKKNQLSTAHALNKQNYMFRTFYGHIYDARNMGPAIRFLGYVNNGLKALYTSWNVVFPFTNFMRDFQEASITQSIKQGTGGKVMVNYKGAFPAVIRNLRGKPDLNNRLDRDLQDFYNLGGATGYTHTKTIEEIEKDVNREVDRMVRKGTVLGSMRNGVGDVLKTVEAWNKVFEDATRFSVYLSSLAAGNSKQDAAIDAKEASVNFNRKGKGSKTWDAYFAFFNVALQSLQKNFKLAKDHTGKFTAIAGSFVALGFLEALMNALADDDDKDSAYYNINPYMRQNYLIIPNLPKLLTTGEKGNKYLSIPLPQFWRGFKSVGSIAFDIATKKMSVKDGIMDAMGNFASALLPVDVAGFYKSGEFSWAPISPTVLKPIVELVENKNYMGYKIMNEPFTRDDKGTLAASRLGKTNVSPGIKYVTDMLFRWGGGKGKYKYYYDHDKLESSKVPFIMDINPSGVEHLIKGYSGGTGAFLTDLVTTISQGANPNQEIDFKNMPFVNKFIRTIPEAKWNIISEYYDLRDDKKINSKLEKEAVKDAETTGDWSTVTAMYGNEYLQRYQETFASFESELDDAMKMKDFDIVEGNRLSVEIMERAISEIKDLKREYGKK